MTSSRLLIASAGRSGTRFVSEVLREAGVNCGHEGVFHPGTPPMPRWGQYVAESSWLCLPWLPTMPDVEVAHLVRNPLHCARSWMGIGVLAHRPHPSHYPYVEHILCVAPGILAQPTPLARFIAYWVVWNETIARFAESRMRIEDLDALESEPLAEIVERLGLGADKDDLKAAHRAVPSDVNTRQVDRDVTWADMRNDSGVFGLRLAALCEEYGYSAEGE